MSHLRSASCDDLTNFASHRDFLLGSQERHTPRTLPGDKAGIHQLIGVKTCDRPSASLCSWVVVRSGLLTLPFPSYGEDIRNDPVKVPEYRLESSPARIGMNS